MKVILSNVNKGADAVQRESTQNFFSKNLVERNKEFYLCAPKPARDGRMEERKNARIESQ